jgi:glycerophosphoryl diester phosphodiesterase
VSSRSPDLPPAFLEAPLAHRGLHDAAAGIVENSRAAVEAAVEAGYGIEIDVQLSADGEAMVFHDDGLDRMTARAGPLRALDAAELGRTALSGAGETIPTLAEILDIVAGRAALLIEIKDQDGALGRAVGPLERRVAELLQGRPGPVAVMGFNPHSMAAFAAAAPAVPRGLTACAFAEDDWDLPAAYREELARLARFDRLGAAFVSHDRRDLDNPALRRVLARGRAVLSWTVRSPEEEAAARAVAGNVTFEGYRPALPAPASVASPDHLPPIEHVGPRARTGRLDAAWRPRGRADRPQRT